MIKNLCAECGQKTLIEQYKEGVIICANCGLVVEKIIEYSRSFTNSNQNLGGAPQGSTQQKNLLSPDYGLGNNVIVSKTDASGKKISPKMLNRLRRLNWLNSRSSQTEIRNLRKAMRELKTLAGVLQLPKEAALTASIYYRKALKMRLIQGRSIIMMVASALYLAAKNHNVPILIKDVENVSNLTKKEITRCLKIYINNLNIKRQLTTPESLVDRIAVKLKLTPATKNEAVKIIQDIKDNKKIRGKSSISIAASTIYIACLRTGERRTQQMVAEAALITPITVRTRAREISDTLTLPIEIKRGVAASPIYFRNPYQMDDE